MKRCTDRASRAPRTASRLLSLLPALAFFAAAVLPAAAQVRGEPDRENPGDEMIQSYLALEAAKLEAPFLQESALGEDWQRERPRLQQEYYHMLGLWPLPEKTPLHATVTRTLDQGDYVVEMLHYQSRPGLYVTGNLYRPAKIEAGEKLPAIFYVCGHSFRPRDGNKTAYQSHGIWFARHGYVCLVVDTLQLGEIEGIHHGTYREDRWWWLSRGYVSSGVEAWNGVRGIDYLVSRDDVDPERIGVTGISGGGASTFWIAAADERVKAAAPVSGTTDLVSSIPNRLINAHCDCMFLYNTFQWPWAHIGGLIAPRPLLFVNSDNDTICPMDTNERLINRYERVYSLLGAGDLVDSVISVGGHAYREDIRKATFRFMNMHLKGDPSEVLDSEVDLVTEVDGEKVHPIPTEQLRVFPEDSDFPADARNDRIDREFVPMAEVSLPETGSFAPWKAELLTELRRLSFAHFPERIPAGKSVPAPTGQIRLATESPIEIRLRRTTDAAPTPERIVMLVASSDMADPVPAWFKAATKENDAVYVCEPRGIGESRWTRKNPPNYVERSHYLLGRTADSGRVWDVVAAARYVQSQHPGVPVHLAGEGASAILAAYAALLEEEVVGLLLSAPPATHMDDAAPAILNVLRVCDVPEVLGMIAPRTLTLANASAELAARVGALYRSAEAEDKLALAGQ